MDTIIIECPNDVQLEIRPRVHVGKRMRAGEFTEAEEKAIAAAVTKVYPLRKSKADTDSE